MPTSTKNIAEQVREAKLKVAKLEEEYKTQLYYETMPEYDPTYRYCYATSNRSLSADDQSFDAWIRAVIKHMGKRRKGHGGASTSAVLVSIPVGYTEAQIDEWLTYANDKLKRTALAYKLRVKNASPNR
jgi:hypothetical protein